MTAYTTTTTRSAGQTLNATMWNALANNDTHFSETLSWNPTVTQSATLARTTDDGWYGMSGKRVVAACRITVNAGGTAGNAITLSLPITAAYANATASPVAGTGIIIDTGTALYQGAVVLPTTTTCALQMNQQSGLVGAAPSFQIINGDFIVFQLCYRAA